MSLASTTSVSKGPTKANFAAQLQLQPQETGFEKPDFLWLVKAARLAQQQRASRFSCSNKEQKRALFHTVCSAVGTL